MHVKFYFKILSCWGNTAIKSCGTGKCFDLHCISNTHNTNTHYITEKINDYINNRKLQMTKNHTLLLI